MVERRTRRRILAGATLIVLLVGVVAVVPRWRDIAGEIKAWLDAPDVLEVNATALEVDFPAGFDEDPSLAAGLSPLRSAWTDLAPNDAVLAVAAALRGKGVAVTDVRCGDAVDLWLPNPYDVVCGASATVRGAELWIKATDRSPSGGVALGRTAAWIEWQPGTMDPALQDRVDAAGPFDLDGAYARPSVADIRAELPPRYSGLLADCATADTSCFGLQAAVDTSDLPEEGAVDVLVAELTRAGFFVRSAESGEGIRLLADRRDAGNPFARVVVVVRPDDGVLVAEVSSL